MGKLTCFFLLRLLIVFIFYSQLPCSADDKSRKLTGPYLGQEPPDTVALLFAEGIVSSENLEHSAPAFSPSGNEVYWTVINPPFNNGAPHIILQMKIVDSVWTEPKIATFSGPWSDGPCYSIDGRHMIITSAENSKAKSYFYRLTKTKSGWAQPELLSGYLETLDILAQPVLTADNSLYFVGPHEGANGGYGIHVSRLVNGEYQASELLPEMINRLDSHDWTPYVDPNESYLIFSSNREGQYGNCDLYISFHNNTTGWTEPVNMGKTINTEHQERFPRVSPDGKYLFFYRKGDIFWIDASIIQVIRSKTKEN